MGNNKRTVMLSQTASHLRKAAEHIQEYIDTTPDTCCRCANPTPAPSCGTSQNGCIPELQPKKVVEPSLVEAVEALDVALVLSYNNGDSLYLHPETCHRLHVALSAQKRIDEAVGELVAVLRDASEKGRAYSFDLLASGDENGGCGCVEFTATQARRILAAIDAITKGVAE